MNPTEPPRFVYHGTSVDLVEDILEEGLKPRHATGKSNWDANETPSIKDHVYLTTLYAGYFGLNARTDDESLFAVVEVDLDRLEDSYIYPDEDFVEQALREDLPLEVPEQLSLNGDMRERTAEIRSNIEAFRHYWQHSLEMLGNVSHRGQIPPEAIRRATIVNPPSALEFALSDPSISIQNAIHMGGKYETLTRVLLGDEVTPLEYVQGMSPVKLPEAVVQQQVESARQILEELQVTEVTSDAYGSEKPRTSM